MLWLIWCAHPDAVLESHRQASLPATGTVHASIVLEFPPGRGPLGPTSMLLRLDATDRAIGPGSGNWTAIFITSSLLDSFRVPWISQIHAWTFRQHTRPVTVRRVLMRVAW